MPKLNYWQSARRGEALGSQLVRLQEQLAAKTHYAGKLENLLRARTQRIDDLTGRLQQSQAQIRRLNEQADHLATLFKG
jgi:chromosome segregation ATPase